MENKEHSWWAPVTNENSLFPLLSYISLTVSVTTL